ncbi:Fe-S oxidoreductase [Sphingobium sp. HWE2-09]|uniref:Fe-S oxidoreductase n=1 Tax=Sphingobium sp. HWE2-09 TaxID=3108390 RepID=UPI002DC219F9|nr:Fe-S oxidoreductase [Sphingobium sp. HWE2-09]
MKSIMLAGVAMLSFTAMSATTFAQDMPAPSSQPPGDATTPPPPADPAATPPSAPVAPATPAAPDAADPNAGQPTGAVPADPGMVPAPAGVPRDPSAPMGSASNPVTVGGNVTPPPTEAKDYPLCSRTVQDSCVNRGEAKMRRKR